MSDENLERYVEKIEDYVERIGSKHVHTQEDSNGTKVICGKYSDKVNYLIVQETEARFRVTYDYDLVKSIGEKLDEHSIQALLDEEDLDDLDSTSTETGREISVSSTIPEEGDIVLEEDMEELPPRYRAARELLDSVDSDVMEKFKFELFQGISSTNVSPELQTTDEGAARRFVLYRNIFPGDEGFSLTEFNRSVVSVVNQGMFGENMANQMMPDIEVPSEESDS
jgi:hypothetical protein